MAGTIRDHISQSLAPFREAPLSKSCKARYVIDQVLGGLGRAVAARLHSAVVDVFDIEPLPPDDALRRHPKILVTPHVASSVSYAARARQVADVLGAHPRGASLPFVYDALRGY